MGTIKKIKLLVTDFIRFKMADIPPIHKCYALTEENDILKKKYNDLKRKYKELHQNLLQVKEELMHFKIEKEYNVCGVKSDHMVRPSQNVIKSKESEMVKESTTSDKLLALNNQLIKQFEKGNKQLKNSEK